MVAYQGMEAFGPAIRGSHNGNGLRHSVGGVHYRRTGEAVGPDSGWSSAAALRTAGAWAGTASPCS
jgi:hypothetical protein